MYYSILKKTEFNPLFGKIQYICIETELSQNSVEKWKCTELKKTR